MYKKVLAIAIVPMLLVLGGTLAFSAWSGQSTAVFGMSTGTASYTQTITFEGTNASVNPILVSADSGTPIAVTSATAPYAAAPSQTGTPSSPVTQEISATNMVAGQYVYFSVVITNTGTVNLALTNMILTVGSQEASYNGGSPLPPGTTFSQPIGSVLLPVFNLNFVAHQAETYNSMEMIFNSTAASIPSSLTPGQSITYDFALIVGGSMSYNQYTNLQLSLEVPMSVLP